MKNSGRLRVMLYAFALAVPNLAIIWPLFSVEFSAYTGSNEGTFIALAQTFSRCWPDLLWWPEWASGLPVQNTYFPLVPLLVAGVSSITSWPAALSFHRVSAFLFVLGPVTVYLGAGKLTGRWTLSFMAAALFSVLSPCLLLSPLIANDAGGMLQLRRLQNIVRYGEAPLFLSLAVYPFALVYVYRAILRNGMRDRVAATLLASVTVLANAFGGILIALAALAALVLIPLRDVPRGMLNATFIGMGAYGLICPFIPPSVMAAIQEQSPTVGGDFRFNVVSALGIAGVALFYAAWVYALGLCRLPKQTRYLLHLAFLICSITLLGANAQVYVVPQPHRYQIALDMSVCLAVCFSVSAFTRRLSFTASRWIVVPLYILLSTLAWIRVNDGHTTIAPIDLVHTSAGKLARWVDSNLGGSRVMISGSYSYPFNILSSVAQVHGGHEPMLPDWTTRIATFTIYTGMNAGGKDFEVSRLWLRALGARAIHVPYAGSPEAFKPFADPHKFDGKLPVLWREGDDVLYQVTSDPSLVHVVPRGAMVRKAPAHGLDVAELRDYVEALDAAGGTFAAMRWRSRHSLQVRTKAQAGEDVSLQIRHHPGWQATVNGVAAAPLKDGLGFIYFDQPCQGDCAIELSYNGGWELVCTVVVSALTAIFLVAVYISSIYTKVRW